MRVSTTDINSRIDALLRQMTLREKVALLAGCNNWQTSPIERLGIPAIGLADGPHGVRAVADTPDRKAGPTTAFPTGAGLASTWDPDLIRRIGAALAEETRAMGCDVLLGPCVNIVRTPLAGRNFESYAEDPYLAGRIGIAYVQGVQSRGIGTSLKHFACNNQEFERGRGSSEVDERTLREIYLPQFEAIVKEAQPWTVMCAYNRINGVYASDHARLLRRILREEWGFEGAVVSDWGAVHSVIDSVCAGVDIEMPGPSGYRGPLLVNAVSNWQMDEREVDDAARRVLRLILQTGRMNGRPLPAGRVNTRPHQRLAREAAEASIVLLKNEAGCLPLDLRSIRTLAVLGPNAAEACISGGGSAFVDPPYRVTPLDGLRKRLGRRVRIVHERGSDNFDAPPPLRLEKKSPQGKVDGGFRGEVFANATWSGKPMLKRRDKEINLWWFHPGGKVPTAEFSIRWTARWTASESGRHMIKLVKRGTTRVYLNGRLVLDYEAPRQMPEWPADADASAYVEMEAGRTYELRIDYAKDRRVDFSILQFCLGYAPVAAQDLRLERAVAAARQADAAVVFVGHAGGFETEGTDRPHMNLPGSQNKLIRAVVAANPKTIVVLQTGAPVTLPWLAAVPAVLQTFYPGMEGGHAIARVLAGDVNPSGRLTVTYPLRYEDNPTFLHYPGAREVRYGEGLYVGYRYYDRAEVAPCFPFGFGLSYTTFQYGKLRVPAQARAGRPIPVAVTVRNTGKRAGQEVVQLYVSDSKASVPRPPQELKRFAKVQLEPGESTTVRFELDARALSFYDPVVARWVAEPGEFEVRVGSSSRDIRARARFRLG